MLNLDWNLLKSFIFVVRNGSLSAASRALSSTQPTIGRHIEALESQVGMPLFTRSREGLTPTEEALDLVPDIEAMLGRFESFIRKIEGEQDDQSGTVRIAASEIVGVEVLPEMLKKFSHLYPRIKIELTLSNLNENLLKRDADIAIRMASPKQDALIAKRIGDIPIRFYAHKSYIKTNGSPKKVKDLKKHQLIGPDRDTNFLNALASLNIDIKREDFKYRLDNQIAQMELVRKGLGIGVMQRPLAKKDPNLIPVLQNKIEVPLPIYLVMHEDLRANKRIRILYQFLIEKLKEYIS